MKPIMCYKCNRQVDKATYFFNPDTDEQIIDVKCHGDSERFLISSWDVIRAEKAIQLPEYAFVPLQPMLTNDTGRGKIRADRRTTCLITRHVKSVF